MEVVPTGSARLMIASMSAMKMLTVILCNVAMATPFKPSGSQWTRLEMDLTVSDPAPRACETPAPRAKRYTPPPPLLLLRRSFVALRCVARIARIARRLRTSPSFRASP